jgi:hypothetical protein
MLNKIHRMTDVQVIAELLGGDHELTTIEHELLDRLIRARAVIDDLEKPSQGSAIVLPVVLATSGAPA